MGFGMFADAVEPHSGQHYDILGEVTSAYTLLPSGMLLAGTDRGIRTSWI